MSPLGYLPLKEALTRCESAWSCDTKDAFERLRPYLHSGDVGSVSIGGNGQLYDEQSAWGAAINAESYLLGVLQHKHLYDDYWFQQAAFVQEKGLTALLDGKQTPPTDLPQAIQQPQKSSGGAPEKYDWDVIWIEVCRIAVLEGLPKSRAELRARIQVWYAALPGKGETPGDSILKRKITKLYQAMGREIDEVSDG